MGTIADTPYLNHRPRLERRNAVFQSALDVRSVFISDLHLGFRGCAATRLLDFLSRVRCETLYLVGDVIDFWYLGKRRRWPAGHSEVLRAILLKAQHGTRVVVVPGNHDDRLRGFSGMRFGNLEVCDHHVHVTADRRRILVIHGDQFDSVVRFSPLLVAVGSNLYDLLLRMNSWVNAIRRYLGRDYWSLSAALKSRVKKAVQYIGRYEEAVARAARRHQVDGVICGHIHRAEISQLHGIRYMNCGDWVESCTALAEHHDGRIELIDWLEHSRRLAPQSAGPVVPALTSEERAA